MNEQRHPLDAIAELAKALGVSAINEMDGCWEHRVDERWWIAANGHNEPTQTSRGGTPVPPYSVYIEYNGWPWGVVDPGGGVVGHGREADLDEFLSAIQRAIP